MHCLMVHKGNQHQIHEQDQYLTSLRSRGVDGPGKEPVPSTTSGNEADTRALSKLSAPMEDLVDIEG